MTSARHIVLLGLMSSGKTSVGRRVAERTGRPLIDGDEVLSASHDGRTAAEFAESDGLDELHRLEAEIALAALRGEEPAVIGPAASVVEQPAVRAALAGHVVVWLSAPAAHLAERAARRSTARSSTTATWSACSSGSRLSGSRWCCRWPTSWSMWWPSPRTSRPTPSPPSCE
jgi:shikimate kinase